MSYDPSKAVNAIYKLKGTWTEANASGNTNAKNEAAAKAQQYYAELRNNNYGYVADELTAADYNTAKGINDRWAKTGKTKTRDYLYSKGKAYGLSAKDVDALISWDNDSKQVSFGGKVIGSPDTIVDGTSYWSDTTKLDEAFDDYITRSGTTRNPDIAINQENENLFKRYGREYEDLKNTNPFTTDEAKAILAKYSLDGLQARDNVVAGNAGSNGGNIDSFAANNALRQQAALITQGQGVVLDAHNQKLEHARQLLSDMGVNIERVHNQNETSKDKQIARDVATAEVTGQVPANMLYQLPGYSTYFNPDGTLKNEDIDYKAEIAKAEAAGDTDLAKILRVARGVKIYGDFDKYGQYADGDYLAPEAMKTEAARRHDDEVAIANKEIDAEERMNTSDNASAETIAGIQADTEKYGFDINKIIAEIQAETDKYGYNTDKIIAEVQAAASKYSDDTDKMIAEIQATVDKYGLDIDLEIAKSNNATDLEIAKANNATDLEIASTKASSSSNSSSNSSGSKSGSKSGSSSSSNSSGSKSGSSSSVTSSGTTSSENNPMTAAQVKSVVNTLNNTAVSEVNAGNALVANADGTYSVTNSSWNEFVVVRVAKMGNLTDEQKSYLIYDVFGISDSVVQTVLKDKHYR